ncbi:NAD-dependent epimerase/dehydratase family protein [Pelomyxa schiedti]|nr:NAD-dependent epimerase/dehydratase family protein [Pelomyxa schiedti]
MAATPAKPNVIVFGGTGFIGRNLVHYLVSQDLCNYVRVVDKVFPQTACLNAAHASVYERPNCQFKQGNLTSPTSITACFALEGGQKFNYVFNCAAETKYGQEEPIYEEKTQGLCVKVATAAVAAHVDKFIQLSTAQVYDGGSKIGRETEAKLSPWTTLAKVHAKTETALKAIPGLPLVIFRPAIVYGPGDITGLEPRIICAAVYKHLGETMKFLWTEDLRINTVHVLDVCRAMWHGATTLPVGALYNLCDKNDTTQGKFNAVLGPIFGIKTGFIGSIKSNLAKMNFKSVTEDVNDKHLKPWSELCKAAGILNTPLTPYLDQEVLYDNNTYVDGTAIERTGFTYQNPLITEALVRDQIEYHRSQRLFP